MESMLGVWLKLWIWFIVYLPDRVLSVVMSTGSSSLAVNRLPLGLKHLLPPDFHSCAEKALSELEKHTIEVSSAMFPPGSRLAQESANKGPLADWAIQVNKFVTEVAEFDSETTREFDLALKYRNLITITEMYAKAVWLRWRLDRLKKNGYTEIGSMRTKIGYTDQRETPAEIRDKLIMLTKYFCRAFTTVSNIVPRSRLIYVRDLKDAPVNVNLTTAIGRAEVQILEFVQQNKATLDSLGPKNAVVSCPPDVIDTAGVLFAKGTGSINKILNTLCEEFGEGSLLSEEAAGLVTAFNTMFDRWRELYDTGGRGVAVYSPAEVAFMESLGKLCV